MAIVIVFILLAFAPIDPISFGKVAGKAFPFCEAALLGQPSFWHAIEI
jgi:hypothetical protein